MRKSEGICSGEIRSPRPVAGSGKYGKERGLRVDLFKDLEVTETTKKQMAMVGNFALSKSTWSNYRTAERTLLQCRRSTGQKLQLPLKEQDVIVLLNWMIWEKKLKHATINSYLAGLRQLHIMKGMGEPDLRAGRVKWLLTGKKNMDIMEKKQNPGTKRLPVTIAVLKLVKALLRDCLLTAMEKLLVWSICCLAFNGCFRIHELLCKEGGKFDPHFTLLNENLMVVKDGGREVIQVWVKWPKENKTGGEFVVEVFESANDHCPVRALKKWWGRNPPREDGLPAFRRENGEAMTGKHMNSVLKDLLKDHVDYKRGKITGHSFRSGVPSILGAAGYTEEEIKVVGRWSSRAYECYTKLPRVKRREMAMGIGSL